MPLTERIESGNHRGKIRAGKPTAGSRRRARSIGGYGAGRRRRRRIEIRGNSYRCCRHRRHHGSVDDDVGQAAHRIAVDIELYALHRKSGGFARLPSLSMLN